MFCVFYFAELSNKLQVVAVDPDSEDDLCRAMQTSQAVVCALGAAESEAFNVRGPFEVCIFVFFVVFSPRQLCL